MLFGSAHHLYHSASKSRMFLGILNLNNNSLTGYIPDTWDANNLIEDLELADNKFKGPLPASLASTPFLKDLVLSRNELTGTIPVNYFNWEALEELYLDENKIGGELPQTQVRYILYQSFNDAPFILVLTNYPPNAV